MRDEWSFEFCLLTSDFKQVLIEAKRNFMRIRITLTPQHYPARFPVNQHAVQSWIYQTVATVAPDFAALLHNEGFRAEASTKNFKFFVFSLPKLPRYTFADGAYCFDQGDVQLQVASPLPNFLEAFVTGLTAQGTFRLGGQAFAVSGLEVLEPPAFHEQMRFAALSPLTVSVQPEGSPTKYYVRAHEADFAPLVVANLCEKYRVLFGTEIDESELEFAFDWAYIEQRGGPERVSKLIAYKDIKIKGYLAPFYVRGNPELIALGWECGFGGANSQGFGMAGI